MGSQDKSRALNSVDDLIGQGLVRPEDRAILQRTEDAFRIRLSPTIAEIHSEGVRRQFLPDARELLVQPAELADPIGDGVHHPWHEGREVHALTHRYPDRVILHATLTCAVYCRFCFRREVVGRDGPLAEDDFRLALAYLGSRPEIREVILTGGDPLTLSARRLGEMTERLAGIPQIETIRIHSRVPVVAPEMISDDLIANLLRRPAVWLVIHVNHADEITPAAEALMTRLQRAGIGLLSQTVLLKGVNDDPDVLEALFRRLLGNRVKPYYLHHPDLARGTGHFRVTIDDGRRIMAALRGRISGMALPTYVLDIPGGYGKVPVNADHFTPDGDGAWIVTDPRGGRHSYRDV